MKTNEIFELGIIEDDTEIIIRDTDFNVLARGNWYEDHILRYSIEEYIVDSFIWESGDKILIDIK